MSLTQINRNQISFTAENHERNEKHERVDHHSFNGKPKATASTGLLYFDGAEPRINVNFHELFSVTVSVLFFSQKAGRVPLPLFGSVSTNRESERFSSAQASRPAKTHCCDSSLTLSTKGTSRYLIVAIVRF